MNFEHLEEEGVGENYQEEFRENQIISNKKNEKLEKYNVDIPIVAESGEKCISETKKVKNRIEKLLSLNFIEPIEESRSALIKSKEEIKKFVEQPLLKACEVLYDKNIKTLASSANKKDIEIGEAYIIIDYDSLSDNNKEIAKGFASPIEYDGINAVKIIIPIDENMFIQRIEKEAIETADAFEKQPMSWAEIYTPNQLLREVMHIPEDNHEFDDPKIFEEAYGFFYVPSLEYPDSFEKGLFYCSKEHYDKSREGNL